MKSDLPKVLHPLCHRPMIAYVLDLLGQLKIKRQVFVLGFKHKEVRKFLPTGSKVVIQHKLRGTGDAVKQAQRALSNFKGTVLIIYADNPLLKKETIRKLLKYHNASGADATLLTATLDKPQGYGRILRDKYFSIRGIVEEKDADSVEKEIKEINTGIACFDKDKLFSAIKKVRPDNRKNEYYLTDVISIVYKEGGIIENMNIPDINEALGINNRMDLAKANRIMQERINSEFMVKGVSIVDPQSTFISFGTKIGRDTVIYPFTVIESDVKIGRRCQVGPFIHLRSGTSLADDVVIGNFLEIARSNIGEKTWLKHFGYIGDSRIGKHVNIGAGTVTANFDGKNKHTTVIKDRAFIGSDTVLVAPVKVGKSSVTGAGAVVLKNRNIPNGRKAVGLPAKLIK